jgi:hypothetical protein
MILINLLPPELRRARRSGISPVFLAAAAGLIVVLGLFSTWMWVEYGRIRAADAKIADLEVELAEATAKADQVKAVEQEITNYEKLHETITKLITAKVFWARTLDDFANLLAQTNGNHWTLEDEYEVRCIGFSVSPAQSQSSRSSRQGETVSFAFRANFRITGKNRDKAGDYVRSFFRTVELSRFWKDNGFVGKAEDPFRGDSPRYNKDLGLVVTDLPLEWNRVKVIPALEKPTAPPTAAVDVGGGK